ncbi:aminopeptidase [Anaerotardibacter muris]|uniref:aminopeptidase n=1 Tax=Anaerotardibacter muris TaxID=2941505 RepID=UPI00203FF204|nr:aminopeptidase [Anaerotardibacter muris]
MERKNAWKTYTETDRKALTKLAESYKGFLSKCKTERACATRAIELAEAAGYIPLDQAIAMGLPLRPGSKVWASNYGKAVMLVQIGTEDIEKGVNILGAHIDSPRLDLKQNPLYEANDFVLLDTHYYGGIKNYQWVALPLALQGVIVKKDGTVVDVSIGENPDEPVFCVTDLLPHLGAEQLKKNGREVVEGESLDVLIGSEPLVLEKAEGADADEKRDEDDMTYEEKIEAMASKEAVRARVLKLLLENYGIEEEDFLSAEIEVVPAGPARDCGLDCSMVIGYGQDDRVCAYTSLEAQLAVKNPKRTAVCILVDKEEIGSVGATGMTSAFFENTMAEILALLEAPSELALRRCLARSSMLSSDVSAAFDPSYASVYETKNSAYCGRGLVFNKYTGSGGKSGSNDANAEYMASLRNIMDEAGVNYQTAELGRVNAGGGGTIAYIPAKYGMNVIDSGVPVLSMHSPWEVTSKADIYEAFKGYVAFLRS